MAGFIYYLSFQPGFYGPIKKRDFQINEKFEQSLREHPQIYWLHGNFEDAKPGETWQIKQENIALLKYPKHSANQYDFANNVITLIKPNTKVYVVKAIRHGYKFVLLPPKTNLSGWIISSSVHESLIKIGS